MKTGMMMAAAVLAAATHAAPAAPETPAPGGPVMLQPYVVRLDKDAVALPIDETGAPLTQSPASQGLDPNAPLLNQPLVDADTGETLSPLAAFLTHAALEAGDNQAQAGQDAIQMMTVHAAKGLEFDAVFITGLEESLFPHENAAAEPDGLEEERRLMYVAITRARQRLHLSFSQTRMLHGQTRYHARSRFLAELPEGALKWLTPKEGGFSGGFSGGFGGGDALARDGACAEGSQSDGAVSLARGQGSLTRGEP